MALVRTLIEDHEAAAITGRQRAILAYAVRLTVAPGAMTEDSLAPLRAKGLSDRDILDVNQVSAYFAYVNRVADGLGVVTDAYAEDAYRAIVGPD